MYEKQSNIKQDFLYPISPYYGSPTNDTVIFNAKLQEFAQKIGFLANLHSSGKVPSEEAYCQVEYLWRELELTKGNVINDLQDQGDR
ncbi:hypothetical protein [Crocosphaera sp.]|uniref:DUF7219 family protein n=1 Tax=Crocosphaera sp. TaxID=2729996 RepID=UPI002613967B|nr:hypothetical protein [Crocosphaera sp.]MDJ0582099.1 hypothetical protein [Crocosphaera sp.]